MSPLTPDEVIGCTDEGPRGFTQVHSAHCRAPTLHTPHCSTASPQCLRSRKKIKGDNALVHFGPGCGAQLYFSLGLPDVAHHIACPVCEGCVGAPRPKTQHRYYQHDVVLLHMSCTTKYEGKSANLSLQRFACDSPCYESATPNHHSCLHSW